MHEIEILGRNLTWTEEGLEYEGSDNHRRALLEGLGLNEESKAVNSAAMNQRRLFRNHLALNPQCSATNVRALPLGVSLDQELTVVVEAVDDDVARA